MNPAVAGARRRIVFMPEAFRPMAFVSRSSPTISGIIACLAGMENDIAMPWSTAAA